MFRNESNSTFLKKVLILISISLILSVPSTLVYADWTNVNPPNVSSNWELFGIQFISANEGWAVGRDSLNNTGVLLHCVNGACTSVSPPGVSLNWGLVAVHFASPNEGWAVGQDSFNRTGALLHFSNGAWTPFTLPMVSTDWQLEGVHFISTSEGWAVGRDSTNGTGVLLHFLNGIWAPFPVPSVSSNWELSAVNFPSSGQGWAVGQDVLNRTGVLLSFSSSTGIWTSITPPSVSSYWGLAAMNFISSNEGWAVGQDLSNLSGVLLHFLNGAWTSVNPPSVSSDWDLQDVDFISSSEGWAVGKDFSNKSGGLLHFLNGAWTSVSPPSVTSDWELHGISLISSTNGWAVGRASDGTNVKGVLLQYSIPIITVSPSKINYKDVAIGALKDQTVTVRNSGNGSLIIGLITLPSPPFSLKTDNCSGKTIALQSSCKLVYRFDPTSGGTFSSNSNIPSNDPSKAIVTVTLSGNGIVGPPLFINLLSPSNGEQFDGCAYYNPPTFQWNPSETFKSSVVQFSLQDDFSTIPVKANGKKGTSELLIPASSWKKVLLLPGAIGGTVYWMVVGTRTDGSLVESDVFSLVVEGPQMVINPTIAPTSKTTPPFPTLTWGNNCNIKLKAWFGNDPDFTKRGMKKTSLSFNIKNPNDNGGQFTKELTTSQWKAIRKVVNDVNGSSIYWYIESSDGLNRSAKTGVNSFVLTE